MEERRKFTRVPEGLKISYRMLPDTKTKEFLIRDLSEGGVRFFTHDFVPKGSLLKISIFLEKISCLFEAIGKVMWLKEDPVCHRYEVGIEFVNIPESATQHLIDYIKSVVKNTSQSGDNHPQE